MSLFMHWSRRIRNLSEDARVLVIFGAFCLLCLAVTALAVLGATHGSLGVFRGREIGRLTRAAFFVMLFLGVLWDLSIILSAVSRNIVSRVMPKFFLPRVSARSRWSNHGFLSAGCLPWLILPLSIFVICESTNLSFLTIEFVGPIDHWLDPALWSFEAPVFRLVLRQRIDVNFWDSIYQSIWLVVFLAFFVISLSRNKTIMLKLSVSFTMIFVLGHFIGALFPLLGPSLFHPESFGYLDGSISGGIIRHLRAQLDSNAAQLSFLFLSGISPVMPSLHVAMASVLVFFVSRVSVKLLYLAVPWFAMNWLSTIFLGWHYVVDGIGGIALAVLCILITQWMVSHALGMLPIFGEACVT